MKCKYKPNNQIQQLINAHYSTWLRDNSSFKGTTHSIIVAPCERTSEVGAPQARNLCSSGVPIPMPASHWYPPKKCVLTVEAVAVTNNPSLPHAFVTFRTLLTHTLPHSNQVYFEMCSPSRKLSPIPTKGRVVTYIIPHGQLT